MVYIFQATTVIGLILVGVWIYLVWMVRRKKTKLAERWLKILKTSLKVAGISFVVFNACVISNIILDLTGREGEPISFWIALVALRVFITATIVGLVIFLIGRRKTT
ncbi:hypothetical protein ES703_119716 [subsurface metagenome]